MDYVSQQLQPYLPGLEPEVGTAKRPHQMSPDEFLASPGVFFHSTSRTVENPQHPTEHAEHDEDVPWEERPWNSPSNTGVHWGSLRAAMERTDYTSEVPREGGSYVVEKAKKALFGKKTMIVGVVHPDLFPRDRKPALDDISAQEAGGRWTVPSVDFYVNAHEDPKSMAAVVPDVTFMKTHADYVREAIHEGRGHEVHPVTMARYKAGNLSAWSYGVPGMRTALGRSVIAGQQYDTPIYETPVPFRPDRAEVADSRWHSMNAVWKPDALDYGAKPAEIGLGDPKLTEYGQLIADEHIAKKNDVVYKTTSTNPFGNINP